MPTIDERIAELKAQGKTESTSKSLGKLVRARQDTGGSTTVFGKTGLRDPALGPSGTDFGASGGGFGDGDFGNLVQRTQQLAQQSIQPAVSTLKSGVSDLRSRYSELIDSIKGSGQAAEQRQTRTTAAELGRRGIDPSSGLGQQQITSALFPVTAEFAQQGAQVGVQGATAQQNIINAIAQLQGQAGTGATGTALDLLGLRQTGIQQQAGRDLAARQFEQVTLPGSQASIANIQSQIADRNKETETENEGVDFLKAQFGITDNGVFGNSTLPGFQTPAETFGFEPIKK